MNKDYNDEQYINSLVDEYKATESSQLRDELLQAFKPYFLKYATIFCSEMQVDLSNKDTLKFLRLFMTAPKLLSEPEVLSKARNIIPQIRKLFQDYSMEDMHNEVACMFLENLKKYRPMVADHKQDKPRISFTHFVQVNIRYRLKLLADRKIKDALSGAYSIEHTEYNEFKMYDDKFEVDVNWNEIDLHWVRGDTASEFFQRFTEAERYLLYLKFSSPDDVLSEYEIADKTGLNRMYVRRKLCDIFERIKEEAAVTI